MSEWKEYDLGDIASFRYGKMTEVKMTGKFPVHSGYRIVGYTDETNYQKGKTIIIARGVGGTGDVKILPFDCWVTNLSIIVEFNDKIVDDRFFYYQHLLNNLAELDSGSAQSQITIQDLNFLKVSLPSKKQQLLIASTLSSLDDKIDLLHRQNKTLEELAETLFRQWFVEEAETWCPSTLENWILFDPREKLDKQKTYQMFEMKCLSNTDMSIGEGVFREVSSATSFRNGDTLLAKITPCLENGKTGFVMHLAENEIAKGSTEFIVMRTKGQVSPYWIYCLARYKDFHDSAVLSMTGTSGRQRVQIDLLRSYEVKVDLKIMEEFHNSVDPYFKKIKSNTNQIRTLTQLRDTLLPKLMSGEVRLNNL